MPVAGEALDLAEGVRADPAHDTHLDPGPDIVAGLLQNLEQDPQGDHVAQRPDRLPGLGAFTAQGVDQTADRQGREDLGHGGAEHQAAGQGHGARALLPLRYGKGQHVVEADVHDRLEQQRMGSPSGMGRAWARSMAGAAVAGVYSLSLAQSATAHGRR